MPLFGKKKDKAVDIEAPEDEGLLMATGGETGAKAVSLPSAPTAAEPDAEAGNDIDDDDLSDAAAAALAAAADVPDGAGVVGEDGAAEAPKLTLVKASAEESSEDDLLSMFKDSESYGELADLIKDLEDVPAADLLAELREIRGVLPPDVLAEGEQAA